jgi:DNA-binding MarR family transcriptional regulator
MVPPAVGGVSKERLATLFSEATGLLHQVSMSDFLSLMADSRLTLPQLVTLHVLDHLGPRSVSDVADRIRLSRAATSHLVDRLVRMGLVGRSEAPDDRRQKRVTLLEKGKALVDRLDYARFIGLAGAVESLSTATRGRLADALEAVIDELKNRPGVVRCPLGPGRDPEAHG